MNFKDINLIREMQKAVDNMEFTTLTEIQERVIPVMREGRDVVGLAPTGSGKTFAFGIPLVEGIDKELREVQALVLCPTRELAMQIESELKKLTEYVEGLRFACIYGGQNFQRQLYSMRKKPQIVIGTTGRVMDHLRRRTLDITHVRQVVLDEADEMLNMGFREDIDTILEATGGGLQVVMFSATMSKEIAEISSRYQYNPVTIKDESAEDKPDIDQYYVKLSEQHKPSAVIRLMQDYSAKLCLVFCNTKKRVDDLLKRLENAKTNYKVGALHGDMFQRHRDAVMRDFRSGNLNILIATDVAARGIDVKDVELIINYDVPNSEEYYVHRIGRTGRAGKSGVAVSLVTKPTAHKIKDCEKAVGAEIKEYKIGGLSEDFGIKERINSKNAIKTERLFLNVGEKDGFNADKLKQYICSASDLDEDKIVEVRPSEVYSFIEVEEKSAVRVIALNGLKVGKRRLVVERAGQKTKASASKSSGKFAKSGKKFDSKSKDRTPKGKKEFSSKKSAPKKTLTETERRRKLKETTQKGYTKRKTKTR